MFQDDEHYTQSFSNTIIYEAVSDEDKPKFESEIAEERISVKKTSPLQESEPNEGYKYVKKFFMNCTA